MLGIIVAVDYEVDKIVNIAEKKTIFNQDFYLINNKVVLTFSGIGKANAARSAANLISQFNVDQVFNIGTSGSCHPDAHALETILVQNCVYGDVDVTIDSSYEINQMPREPKYFKTNFDFNEKLASILNELKIEYKKANVITVDSFVTKHNFNKFNEIASGYNLAIDMESTSLAQTCLHMDKPFSAIKFISDVYNSTNNHDQFLENVKIISQWIDNVIMKLIQE